jgi:hypothetical protein
MRPAEWAVLGAVMLAAAFGGCRKGLAMGESRPARASAPLVWRTIPADVVEVLWSRRHHSTGFGVPIPPPAWNEGFARQMELRFSTPLESAKVSAFGVGPRHRVPLLDERRVRGAAVSLALPALTLDRVEVVVHHHLRTPPLPPEVRVGREVRP